MESGPQRDRAPNLEAPTREKRAGLASDLRGNLQRATAYAGFVPMDTLFVGTCHIAGWARTALGFEVLGHAGV
jgi:hypothetical protein